MFAKTASIKPNSLEEDYPDYDRKIRGYKGIRL